MTAFVRLLSWIVIITIVVFSLAPTGVPLATGSSAAFDHFLAYLIAGLALSLAYSARVGVLPLAAALAFLAGALEIAQLNLTARESHWSDFLAGAAGGVVGVALVGSWRKRVE